MSVYFKYSITYKSVERDAHSAIPSMTDGGIYPERAAPSRCDHSRAPVSHVPLVHSQFITQIVSVSVVARHSSWWPKP